MDRFGISEYIMDEYKQLKKQRQDYKNAYNEYLYSKLPELREIDSEISSLAITCASKVVKGELTVEQAFEFMEKRRDELNTLRKEIIASSDIKRYQPLPYKCSICSDTGFVDGNKCVCYKKKVRDYMIESSKHISNFSCDINNDTFENFAFGFYSKSVIAKLGISPYDYMMGVYKKCIEYCNTFSKDSDNLFFTGEPGRGKTFMANCIANKLLSEGFSVVYQSSYKLFQFLEDYKFGKTDKDSSDKIYNSIYDCDMLIIDDLGTEFITSYTCSVFFDVINSRLLNNKKTMISTNLSMNDISKNYTERVASRIKGEFNAIHFIGEDIRVLKRNKK